MLLGPRKGTRFSAPQGHLAVPRGWRFCAGAGLGGTHAWGSGAEGRGALGEGDREGASVVLKAGLAGPGHAAALFTRELVGKGPQAASYSGPPHPPSRRPRFGRLCVVPDVAGRGRWGHTQTRTRAVDTRIHIHVCVCTRRTHAHPELHLVLARPSTGSKRGEDPPQEVAQDVGSELPEPGFPGDSTPWTQQSRPPWSRQILLPLKSVFREMGLGSTLFPPHPECGLTALHLPSCS